MIFQIPTTPLPIFFVRKNTPMSLPPTDASQNPLVSEQQPIPATGNVFALHTLWDMMLQAEMIRGLETGPEKKEFVLRQLRTTLNISDDTFHLLGSFADFLILLSKHPDMMKQLDPTSPSKCNWLAECVQGLCPTPRPTPHPRTLAGASTHPL